MMVSYAVFIYNRRLYTQYVYTFFEGAAAGKFDEYHSLRAPYGLPTGSLRAPYGLPTGSLRECELPLSFRRTDGQR